MSADSIILPLRESHSMSNVLDLDLPEKCSTTDILHLMAVIMNQE